MTLRSTMPMSSLAEAPGSLCGAKVGELSEPDSMKSRRSGVGSDRSAGAGHTLGGQFPA
jgi:hypothetical protein